MEKKSDRDRKKHIIISGGSRGLGFATCEYLLEAGFSVSTFSRVRSSGIDDLMERFSENLFHYNNVDITSHAELSDFIEEAFTFNENFWGLINNAAIVQDGVLATLPGIEINKMISVNLEGSIILSRLFLRKMFVAEKGRVINISSIIGSRGYTGLSVYSASKAGLDGFTRSLAREIGKRNITVNSLAPGYMRTDMSSELSEDQVDQIIKRTPMQRLAEVGDVIPLIGFLLSEESSFITGQTIIVDGGITV